MRTFERHGARVDLEHFLPGGTSTLVCGNSGYSYRHIFKNHRGDWEHDARVEGTNWRDHADWSIEVTLRDPQVVAYRSQNDSYCYSRAIQLWDKSNRRHVTDRIIIVAVSTKTARIITAYPNSKFCSSET